MKTVDSDGTRPRLGWAERLQTSGHHHWLSPAPGTRSQCFIESNIKTDNIGYIVVVLLLVTAPVFLLTLISTMKYPIMPRVRKTIVPIIFGKTQTPDACVMKAMTNPRDSHIL